MLAEPTNLQNMSTEVIDVTDDKPDDPSNDEDLEEGEITDDEEEAPQDSQDKKEDEKENNDDKKRSRRDSSSKSKRLKKELDADEEKKRLLKEKLRQVRILRTSKKFMYSFIRVKEWLKNMTKMSFVLDLLKRNVSVA